MIIANLLEQGTTVSLPFITSTWCAEAWSTRFWMAHYGGPTPKRHKIWCSSPAVGKLDLGILKGFNRSSETYQKAKTATTEVKHGKKTFQGNKKALKDSQYLN